MLFRYIHVFNWDNFLMKCKLRLFRCENCVIHGHKSDLLSFPDLSDGSL